MLLVGRAQAETPTNAQPVPQAVQKCISILKQRHVKVHVKRGMLLKVMNVKCAWKIVLNVFRSSNNLRINAWSSVQLELLISNSFRNVITILKQVLKS